MNGKVCKLFFIVVVACLVGSSLSGCRGHLARDEKIGRTGEMVLVVDATVIDERTLKAARLDVGKCEAIAGELETVAGRMLERKGYRSQAMIRTVGLGFDPARNIEVMFDSREHEGVVSSSPPYILLTQLQNVDMAQVAGLHRRQADEGRKYSAITLGSRPILLVSARGTSVSSGAMLGNVAKGAVNVIATIGSRQAAKVMEFDRDTVDLAVKLIDPASGEILWQAGRQLDADPDADNFGEALKTVLRDFPHSQPE